MAPVPSLQTVGHSLLPWLSLLLALVVAMPSAIPHAHATTLAHAAAAANSDPLKLGQLAPPWQGWLGLQPRNETAFRWNTVPANPDGNSRPICVSFLNGILAPGTGLVPWLCAPDFREEFAAVPVSSPQPSSFQLRLLTGGALSVPYCIAARGAGCAPNSTACTVVDGATVGIWPCSTVGDNSAWLWDGRQLRLAAPSTSSLSALYLVLKYPLVVGLSNPSLPIDTPEAFVVSNPSSTQYVWSNVFAAAYLLTTPPDGGSVSGDRVRLKSAISLPPTPSTGNLYGENTRNNTYRTAVLTFREHTVCWELAKLDLTNVHPASAAIFKGSASAIAAGSTSPGTPAVQLFGSGGYAASGCSPVVASDAAVASMVASPASYYLEITDVNGAGYTLRGQLGTSFNVTLAGSAAGAVILGSATLTVGSDFVCVSGLDVGAAAADTVLAVVVQPPGGQLAGAISLVSNMGYPGLGLLACNATSLTAQILENPATTTVKVVTTDYPTSFLTGTLTKYNTDLPPLAPASAPATVPATLPVGTLGPVPSPTPSGSDSSSFPLVAVVAGSVGGFALIVAIGLACLAIACCRREKDSEPPPLPPQPLPVYQAPLTTKGIPQAWAGAGVWDNQPLHQPETGRLDPLALGSGGVGVYSPRTVGLVKTLDATPGLNEYADLQGQVKPVEHTQRHADL